MSMKRTFVTLLLAGSLMTGGCLRKEAIHTLYLSPDGSIRWSASESHVYSDAEDPGERFAEEQGFIGPALTGGHTTALALKALGPTSLVDSTVVRDERPFHVITQARFDRIDTLFARLLRELGVHGRAEMVSEAGTSTLLMTLDFSREPEQKAGPVVRMLEESRDVRIVLTTGRIAESSSFDIADRVQARISDAWREEAQKALAERRAVQLRLTWYR
jgi:hypothetical protein